MRSEIGIRVRAIYAAATFFAFSQAASAAQIVVSDAWIRSLPGNVPAGGYFVITNSGARLVVLTGASSKDCGMLMLHKSDTENGMARMSGMDSVSVPAHGKVSFAPGGFHLMCSNPSPAIKPGGKILITLEFSDGIKLPVQFAVRNARGQ